MRGLKPGFQNVLGGGHLDLLLEPPAKKLEQIVMGLVGYAAQRIGCHNDPVAEIHCVQNRRENAYVGLPAGDHDRIYLAIL